MKSLIQRLNPKKIAIVLGSIALLLVINRVWNTRTIEGEPLPEEQAKLVSVVEFGHWSPTERREIVGTIVSDTDVDIRAEVSGTIGKTFVSIGDTVTRGQALASFQQGNDVTQISYENLLQQLAVAKIQTASSVQAATIGLESAQRQLAQTKASEAQNYSRTFDLLRTQARNAESEFRKVINWMDGLLMVSTTAQASVNYQAQQIGMNNSIMRQNMKTQIEVLLRDRTRIDQERLPLTMSDDDALFLANDRLQLLKKIQTTTRSLTSLIQGTPITGSLSQTQKSTYETQATGFVGSIDAAVLSLESQIESAKSEQGRNKLSVLGVENAVHNAEAALAVTKAQAESQITQIETQLRLARNSQEDLVVRAPFNGTITGKTVLPFDQVTTGNVLFSMVGTNIEPKITSTITNDELARIIANANAIQAELEDGTMIDLPEFQIGGKLDAMTQKLTVDFPLQTLPENVLVGSFVKILLPIDGIVSNLLPISALSFEPDGAEVLIIEAGKGKRIKVAVGKLVSNAVEIKGGLEIGSQVVQYRNRAHAGELLEIRK